MSELFDNYPQPSDYIPNNRRKCFPKKEITIMAGETTIHSFEIPLNAFTDLVDFDIIYRLGIHVVVVKNKKSCTVVYDEDTKKSNISCTLSKDDTKLFKETLEQAQVQLRFVMRDLSTSYSNIYPITLIDSLDNGPFTDEQEPPTPHIMSGIGYTED